MQIPWPDSYLLWLNTIKGHSDGCQHFSSPCPFPLRYFVMGMYIFNLTGFFFFFLLLEDSSYNINRFSFFLRISFYLTWVTLSNLKSKIFSVLKLSIFTYCLSLVSWCICIFKPLNQPIVRHRLLKVHIFFNETLNLSYKD